MCKIEVNGVSIVLTKDQLKQIKEQTKKVIPIYERVVDLKSLCKELNTTEAKLLPYPKATTKFEKYVNACVVLAKVVELYNEGTILDWKNSNIYKYSPYRYFSGGGYSVSFFVWSTTLYGSALVYLKSNELSKLSYENFKDQWENYWSVDV